MKKLIIDTNFLLIPGEFKVDIFSEIHKIAHFQYKIMIIDKTVDELNKIINNRFSSSKDKLNAKIGLGLIEKKKIDTIESGKNNVDDAIVENSDQDTIVATSDKELKRRLRLKNVKIINLRKKQYLKME
jgi:uncharacterized protein